MTVVSNIGAEVDFQIAQGSEFAVSLTMNQPNGSPYNQTGAIVTALIKDSNESSLTRGEFTVIGTGLGCLTLTLDANALNGTFVVGDTIVGATSGWRGTVVSYDPIARVLVLGGLTGDLIVGEALTD